MTQHTPYLESKILTAPPHKLHLMLIEGALRFGRKADEALRRDDTSGASAALLRVIDIVGEMLAGVRAQKSNLNAQLAGLYWFMFRRVIEAKLNADAAALAEVLRLLEYERETWQLVCDRVGDAAHMPHDTDVTERAATHQSSLSLEA